MYIDLKDSIHIDVSRLKIGVIYEGDLEEPRGTPIRMLRWAELGARSGVRVNVLASSMSSELANKIGLQRLSNARAIIDDSDLVFVLNYNGLFHIKKLLRKSGCQIVVDLHSLRSRELRKLQLFEFLRQTMFELIASILARRYRALLVPVNERMTKRYLANLGNRVLEIQGGTTDYNLIGREFKFDFGYAGNSRKYQGLDFLINTFDVMWQSGEVFSALIIVSEPVSNFENRPYLTVVNRLKSVDALNKIAECRVLVVPRVRARENRYSFPSKVYDYLSTDSAILLSREVPPLPMALERTILRSETGNTAKFGDSLMDALRRVNRNEKFDREYRNDYSWDSQFSRILKGVLNGS